MVKRSKGQYAAVLVILITGLTFYTAMSMASLNLESTKASYFQNSQFADLFLSVAEFPAQKVEDLGRTQGIAQAEGRLSLDVPLIVDQKGAKKEERVTVRMVSTRGDEQQLNRLFLIEGRMPSEGSRQLVLVKQFAKARKIAVGEEITLQINGIRSDWKVSGIVLSPEYIYLMENNQSLIPSPGTFGVAFAPEGSYWQVSGTRGSYNEINVQYSQDAVEDTVIDHLEETLAPYGLQAVTKSKDQLSNNMLGEEINGLKRMSSTLPLVFLLTAGLILTMMLSRMVKRDRFKIGILKAMGYSNRKVLGHYVKYAASAGVIGGLIGSLAGMGLAGVMTRYYLEFFYMPLFGFVFYPGFLAVSLFLACLFCVAAGLLGAKGVLAVAPAEALQPEVPRSGKRILLERWRGLWKRFRFSQKLIIKNIFRNKKRALFILAGVTLTYGMMLFTMSMPDVMTQFMDQQFTEFQKMDYNVTFKHPVNQQAVRDLSHLIDTDAVEGKIEYPFALRNGTREKFVSVIGVRQDSVFFHFTDPLDRPVKLPKHGILLSENLARALDVKIGDSIKIHTYLPNREDLYIEVAGVVKQTLGINAYLDQEEMGKLLFEQNAINGAWFDSSDPGVISKLNKATNIASIAKADQMRAAFDEYTGMIVVGMGFMTLFSGILGFAIVYSATAVSISEREMEFSSLRVLGFGKNQLFRMVLTENNLIAVVGILLGLPFGAWLLDYSSKAYSTDVYTITMRPTLQAAGSAILLTLLFLVLAQVATYWKISRLDFLQALKNRAS